MLRAHLSQNSLRNNPPMVKMPFVKQEIAELCRICETMENLLDISTEEFSHLNEKLHRIADFEDDYSSWLKFICVSCGTKLENAFDFKIQCEDTYRKFVDQMESSIFPDPFYNNSHENHEENKSNHHSFMGSENTAKEKAFFEIYEVVELQGDGGNENNAKKHNQYVRPNPKITNNRTFSNNTSAGNFMKIVDVESRKAEKPQGSFRCAMCDETFKEKWKMREHMQRAHLPKRRHAYDNGENKFNIGPTGPTMFRHPPTPIEKKFPCSVCGRLFRTKAYMEIHKQEHAASSKLRSLLDESTSSDYNATDMYGAMEHDDDSGSTSMYKCQLCDKTFQRRQGLRVHYQIHTDERPYPCTYCEKAFRCRSHLNRHIYTHTGEKKYKCQVCHKCFTQSGSLRIHMRIHTGELPYECVNCFMRFRVRKTLLNHEKRCPPMDGEWYK